jgi:folate-binding protein YgfZ
MARNSFTLLDGRAVLSVTGEDRAGFLQGLVSNDTAKLAPGRAVYAALLTAQGRYLHDFIMTAAEDAIWLDCEAARLADLQRRLAIYKLRAKVALAARPDLAVAAIWGPDPPEIGVADPRLAALGRRLVAPRDGLAATLVAAGLEPADFAAYDRHRLALGIPDGSRDLPVEKALLLENGFDELNGVDWHKGCYIGQELTARTKYRGLVKKRLFPVRIEGAAPEPGSVLSLDGREAGEMRSSRDGMGLALLRLDMVEALTRPNPTRLVAWTPQWMRLPE